MSENTKIAFCLDEGFALPTAVSLYTLCKHLTGSTPIHIVGLELSSASWNNFSRIAAHFEQELIRHPLSSDEVELPDRHSFAHISKGSYLRVILPSLLDGRVLYLDGDLTIRGDLRPLLGLDLDDFIAAAAPDANHLIAELFFKARDDGFTPRHKKSDRFAGRMGYHEKWIGKTGVGEHFNAGVLLMDLDRLEEFPEIAREFRNVETLVSKSDRRDQVHVNRVFKDKIQRISLHWNMQAGLFRDYDFITGAWAEEIAAARKNAAIWHHTSAQKPWNPLRQSLRARNWQRVLQYRRDMRGLEREIGIKL